MTIWMYALIGTGVAFLLTGLAIYLVIKELRRTDRWPSHHDAEDR